MERLKIILHRWSCGRESVAPFQTEPEVLDETWYQTIEYLNSKPKIKYVDYGGVYLLSHDHLADFEKFFDMLDCDEECFNINCELVSVFNLDSFMEFNNSIKMVKFNAENWKFSTCTCYNYLKTFMCKHIIVIALSNKVTAIPEKYYDSVIGSKPKPGKKKKARAWNFIQNY
jgi:hypothetical protein